MASRFSMLPMLSHLPKRADINRLDIDSHVFNAQNSPNKHRLNVTNRQVEVFVTTNHVVDQGAVPCHKVSLIRLRQIWFHKLIFEKGHSTLPYKSVT